MGYSYDTKCNMSGNLVISSFESRNHYEEKKPNAILNFAVDNNFQPRKEEEELSMIINKIKDLDESDNKDGISTLSAKDLALAKTNATNLFGQNAVIKADPSCGLTTIQLENGHVYAFDFEVDGEKKSGISQLKEDIANGCAEYTHWYNPNIILGAFLQSSGGTIQDEITITGIKKGTSMREIKDKYNLPDGALKSYVCLGQHASGDRDAITTDGNTVWFSAKAFAKNNNLTMDQVKSLFKKK